MSRATTASALCRARRWNGRPAAITLPPWCKDELNSPGPLGGRAPARGRYRLPPGETLGGGPLHGAGAQHARPVVGPLAPAPGAGDRAVVAPRPVSLGGLAREAPPAER